MIGTQLVPMEHGHCKANCLLCLPYLSENIGSLINSPLLVSLEHAHWLAFLERLWFHFWGSSSHCQIRPTTLSPCSCLCSCHQTWKKESKKINTHSIWNTSKVSLKHEARESKRKTFAVKRDFGQSATKTETSRVFSLKMANYLGT